MANNQAYGNKVRNEMARAAKRVEIVSVKLCRETSVLYSPRYVRNPKGVVKLVGEFLAESDREVVLVVGSDKTSAHCISTVSIELSIIA